MLRRFLSKLIGSKKTAKKTAKKKPAAKPKTKTSQKKRPASPEKRPARKNPAQPKKFLKSRKKSPAKRVKPSSKKISSLPPGAKEVLGEVIGFFRIPVVAVVKVTQGTLKPGDRIWIRGHTTDLKETLSSLQIDHVPVREVKKGQEAGLKVSGRARRGDRVYRIA